MIYFDKLLRWYEDFLFEMNCEQRVLTSCCRRCKEMGVCFFLIGVKESICRLSVAHAGLVEASLDTVNQATGGGNFVEEIKEMKRIGCEIGSHFLTFDTVDGRNPKQPPGMYKNPMNSGINYQPQLVNVGFLNHQQYV